jgi:hypothetical protein
MGITVTATSIQPKDITISETGEKVTVTDSTATVSNIIKDTLTLTLAGGNLLMLRLQVLLMDSY